MIKWGGYFSSSLFFQNSNIRLAADLLWFFSLFSTETVVYELRNPQFETKDFDKSDSQELP